MWHAGGMWIFWLLVLVVVGLVVVFAVRSLARSEPRRESPREILAKRYARGEIDRAEYQRAMEDLRQS